MRGAYPAFPNIILCKYIKTWIHIFSKTFFLGTHIFAFECQVHLLVIVINLGLYKFFHILWFPISRSIIFNYVWKPTVQIAQRKQWALFIAEAFFPLKPFFYRRKELNSREKKTKKSSAKTYNSLLSHNIWKKNLRKFIDNVSYCLCFCICCAKKYQWLLGSVKDLWKFYSWCGKQLHPKPNSQWKEEHAQIDAKQ